LQNRALCAKFPLVMNTVISPVNTKDRAQLGIKSGDTVRVWQKIQEKDKTRLQAFEGTVLAVKHGSEAGATFTVRRTTGGFGVEKIFPLYSPMIDKIEIIKRAKVRRSKLYHIREKASKEIRRQMRNMKLVSISTSDEKKEDKSEEVKIEDEVKVESSTVVEEEKTDKLKKEETPQENIGTIPAEKVEEKKEEGHTNKVG
jgi:large subunit ribosomal protein L19